MGRKSLEETLIQGSSLDETRLVVAGTDEENTSSTAPIVVFSTLVAVCGSFCVGYGVITDLMLLL